MSQNPIAVIPAADDGRIELHNPVTDDRASVATAAGQPVNVYYHKAVAPPPPPPPPPPPTSEWPTHAWTPDGKRVEEVTSGLRDKLERWKDAVVLFVILDDSAIDELNQITQGGDPSLLASHYFTPRPDEFGVHPLTINLGGHLDSPGFQGFRPVPSGNGYHARHTGTGVIHYRLMHYEGGYKGILSTGRDANISIYARFCSFSGMRGSQCAGVYHVRGEFYGDELVFTDIGHARGEKRGPKAELNHAIYCQWEVRARLLNCYMDTADSHAVQLRGGGEIYGILANRTANGVLFGHDKTDRPIVNGILDRAILANTEDIDPGKQNTGVGVWARRCELKVFNTIIADEKSVGEGAAFRPQHDAAIWLGKNVRVRGVPRLIDVDGHRTKMTGTLLARDHTTLVNARNFKKPDGYYERYDISDINVAVSDHAPFSIPDLDKLPTPKPGEVGSLINSIIGGGQ